MSAMKEAFERAGAPIGRSALYTLASDRLRKSNRNAYAALESFVDDVIKGAETFAALWETSEIRGRALEYLKRVAADMSGGQGANGHQKRIAAAQPNSEDGANDVLTPSTGMTIRPIFRLQLRGAGMKSVLDLSEIGVVAKTRNEFGTDWGRLLLVKDNSGFIKAWLMPMSILADGGCRFRRRLRDLGFKTTRRRSEHMALFECVTALGVCLDRLTHSTPLGRNGLVVDMGHQSLKDFWMQEALNHLGAKMYGNRKGQG